MRHESFMGGNEAGGCPKIEIGVTRGKLVLLLHPSSSFIIYTLSAVQGSHYHWYICYWLKLQHLIFGGQIKQTSICSRIYLSSVACTKFCSIKSDRWEGVATTLMGQIQKSFDSSVEFKYGPTISLRTELCSDHN